MEKIYTIYLAGKNYKITESAYKLLSDYDRFLNKKYKDEEFLLDVETQMAAILDTDLHESERVVEYADIEEAIRLIGENENIRYYPGSQKAPTNSKVYRNTEKGILGGVAAGFADYLNIDPVVLRVLFIVVSFFTPGIIIYIVLWIVLPAQQKFNHSKNKMFHKTD